MLWCSKGLRLPLHGMATEASQQTLRVLLLLEVWQQLVLYSSRQDSHISMSTSKCLTKPYNL